MSFDLETRAPTGSTVYAIIRNSSAQVWSVLHTAWETWVDANYAHYTVALTEQGTSGFFVASMPAGIVQTGFLAIEFFAGAGSEGDTFVSGGSIYWAGASTGSYDTGTALTSLAYVKDVGGIAVGTYDSFLQNRIYALSKAIEHYCRRTFAQQSYADVVDGAGSAELLLPQFPVASVTSVVLDFNGVAPTTINGSDLVVNLKTGILTVKPASTNIGWFPYGFQNIQVNYTAGYSPIPNDLQEICAEAVLLAFNRMGKDMTMMQEKIGDYQYVNRGDCHRLLTDDMMLGLNYYRQSIV